MSEQTTPDQRRSFFEQHHAGRSYRQIAEAAHVSPMCVRYWYRRLRNGKPAKTTYHRGPAGSLHSFDPMIRYVVLRLRLEHPGWDRTSSVSNWPNGHRSRGSAYRAPPASATTCTSGLSSGVRCDPANPPRSRTHRRKSMKCGNSTTRWLSPRPTAS